MITYTFISKGSLQTGKDGKTKYIRVKVSYCPIDSVLGIEGDPKEVEISFFKELAEQIDKADLVGRKVLIGCKSTQDGDKVSVIGNTLIPIVYEEDFIDKKGRINPKGFIAGRLVKVNDNEVGSAVEVKTSKKGNKTAILTFNCNGIIVTVPFTDRAHTPFGAQTNATKVENMKFSGDTFAAAKVSFAEDTANNTVNIYGTDAYYAKNIMRFTKGNTSGEGTTVIFGSAIIREDAERGRSISVPINKFDTETKQTSTVWANMSNAEGSFSDELVDKIKSKKFTYVKDGEEKEAIKPVVFVCDSSQVSGDSNLNAQYSDMVTL